MKHKTDLTSGRTFGFRRTNYTVTVVSLLAAAAAFGNVPAAAGPSAIIPIDAEDTPIDAENTALVIVGAPQLPEMHSDIRVPQTGIGSLYWALRHPTQAWRILLPEQ
jgi:hypothetical protein